MGPALLPTRDKARTGGRPDVQTVVNHQQRCLLQDPHPNGVTRTTAEEETHDERARGHCLLSLYLVMSVCHLS